MSNDFILLAVIALIELGGGVFLLFKAKEYRTRRDLAATRLSSQSGD